MAEPIAICGNRCGSCPAHRANVGSVGREVFLGGWLRYHGLGVMAPEEGCAGCPPMDGGDPPFPECQVRRCAKSRGLSSCSDCSEPSCDSWLAALTFERARLA